MVMDSRESRLSSLLDSFIEEHRDEIAANQSDAAVTDYVAAYLEKMPSLPETVASTGKGYTARFLKEKLSQTGH